MYRCVKFVCMHKVNEVECRGEMTLKILCVCIFVWATMFWSRKIRFEAWLSEAVVIVVGNPLTFFGEGWKRKWNVISVHIRLSLFFLSAVFLFHRLIFFLSVCLSLLLLFLLLFVCRLRLWSPYPGECVDCCWCHCHCHCCCCFILNISFFIRSLSSIKSTHSHNMRYIIFFLFSVIITRQLNDVGSLCVYRRLLDVFSLFSIFDNDDASVGRFSSILLNGVYLNVRNAYTISLHNKYAHRIDKSII